jgi:hypothetical protein
MPASSLMFHVESFINGYGALTVASRLPRGALPAPSAADLSAIAQSCIERMLGELERLGVRVQSIQRSRIHAPDRQWLPALLASRDAALKPCHAVNALVMHTGDADGDAFTVEFDVRLETGPPAGHPGH